MKRILSSVLMAFLLINVFAYSQTMEERVDTARIQIEAILSTDVNGPYNVGEVIDVDSSIGTLGVADGKITNPYGTLNRCYLFMARTQGGEGKHTVGVYRDNQIVWMSGSLPGSQNYGDQDEAFLATKDLNCTGRVDIVAYFSDGTNPPSGYYLWIYSWNGSQGICINKQESSGGTSIASTGAFDICDVDGDGIDEIVSFNSGLKANSAYSWNGSFYGDWPTSPNLQGKSYTISNNLTAIVKSRVQRIGEKLRYSYEVTNSNNSKQKIGSFCVRALIDTIDNLIVPTDWEGGQWAGYPLVNCFTEGENLQIGSGHTLRTFSFDCLDLPIITAFYVQGPSYSLDNSTSDPDTLMEVAYKNVLNNSFIGTTISPTKSTTPFIPLNFLDTLTSYTTQSRTLGWIKDQPTANKYLGYFVSAKTGLQQNNITSTRSTLNQVLQDANTDSTSLLTSEAYALIRFNTEYLLSQLPTNPPPGCTVKLVNSTGSLLTNGTLQYRDTTWKDVTNNNDGTFTIATTKKKLSLRMTYEYGTQTKANVSVKNDTTIIFQTKNVSINLQTSTGNPLDTGTVQYYSGAWRDLGTTTNGVVSKELLPVKYNFKMTYNNASNQKAQNIDSNAVVVFQTVNASVQLKNSLGNFMPAPLGDQGVVQYNAGGWKDFGITSNGSVQKELLPAKYNFKMTYASASKNQSQDLDSSAIVVFQTSNVSVQLKNSQGIPLDTGIVQYNAGGWKDFGTTINGMASKELLANKYSFRITYAFVNNTKAQDIDSSNIVNFSTVLCTVRVTNSSGQLVSNAIVTYNAGGYRPFGTTVNGITTKELLPANITFRVQSGKTTQTKAQDITTNPNVEIMLP